MPDGEVTSFPRAVKCKASETVVFSWILWPSREARDQGMQKVMQDSRMNMKFESMPFDSQRMIYSGFEIIVDE